VVSALLSDLLLLCFSMPRERESNLLVRIHCIIVMIRWTGQVVSAFLSDLLLTALLLLLCFSVPKAYETKQALFLFNLFIDQMILRRPTAFWKVMNY